MKRLNVIETQLNLVSISGKKRKSRRMLFDQSVNGESHPAKLELVLLVALERVVQEQIIQVLGALVLSLFLVSSIPSICI